MRALSLRHCRVAVPRCCEPVAVVCCWHISESACALTVQASTADSQGYGAMLIVALFVSRSGIVASALATAAQTTADRLVPGWKSPKNAADSAHGLVVIRGYRKLCFRSMILSVSLLVSQVLRHSVPGADGCQTAVPQLGVLIPAAPARVNLQERSDCHHHCCSCIMRSCLAVELSHSGHDL